jgi:hypothetical protein
VSQKYHVRRSVILQMIAIAETYDDEQLPSSQQIEQAIRILDRIKVSGLPQGS